METTFEQGWAARPFKQQFPILKDESASRLDEINKAITLLRLHGLLTDGVHKDLRQKKMAKVVKEAVEYALRAQAQEEPKQ